ncbi:MAG: S-layer protein [Methanoregula sp.]|nr:S-layer protein [Methanoregula sp.]
MSGSPELSAYIFGSNELRSGDEVSLTIVIQNTGLNEYKYEWPSIVDPDDQPNTAKFLAVTLQAGDAPLTIKSDPQMVGDLKGGSSIKSVFLVKVNADAPEGTYTLPLKLSYTYFDTADQYGVDTIEYTYKTADATISVPVKIRSDLYIDVVSSTPEHLNVGSDGYLNMKIMNTGYETGTKTIVQITRNGNSPIIPIDSSVYIGDFIPGSIVDCRYKVTVLESAESQAYPVDVSVVYQNTEGDFVTSNAETIGVPVGGKVEFEIASEVPVMNPGNKKEISVIYKNTGDTPVYSAQARISAVDPFSSYEDTAYLGDIQPGQSATANYVVSVDRSATKKEYGLDSEIRYRDALDNTYISDTMKVPVNIVAADFVTSIMTNPIYLSIIAAVIIGIAYAVYHYRKK